MAELTITASNVGVESDTVTQKVKAGEAIAVGEVVYEHATNGKYFKADSNAGDTEATPAGIAMTPAAADEDEIIIATEGNIRPGATLVIATQYIVASTAGKIDDGAGVASGWRLSPVFMSVTTSIAKLNLNTNGAARP